MTSCARRGTTSTICSRALTSASLTTCSATSVKMQPWLLNIRPRQRQRELGQAHVVTVTTSSIAPTRGRSYNFPAVLKQFLVELFHGRHPMAMYPEEVA